MNISKLQLIGILRSSSYAFTGNAWSLVMCKRIVEAYYAIYGKGVEFNFSKLTDFLKFAVEIYLLINIE